MKLTRHLENEKGKVSCKEVIHHICESLGEDLNSDKCIAIKSHLDECANCKNYFQTVEVTIDWYKNIILNYRMKPTINLCYFSI